MKCPFMTEGNTSFCTAVEGLVVLSGFELERFCANPRFRNCPIYQKDFKSGHKITLRDYNSIFNQAARESTGSATNKENR